VARNITLSAEEGLIRRAREMEIQHKTTLNALFREWLARYVGSERAGEEYSDLMERLAYGNAGKHFSRDELNER